jgi:hypothetical protein
LSIFRIPVATSAAVAGCSGSAIADVGDGDAADVPPSLEQPASPATLIATRIRLALRHLLVNIDPPNAQKSGQPIG